MDFTGLIEGESAKIAALHAAVHHTSVNRDRGKGSRQEWEDACVAFHSYVSPLYRFLELARNERQYTNPELLEFAIRFLELDPWFFRSGYLKQILLTRLKRSDLNERAQERLRRVLIDAVNRRGTREFRYYCRLAAVLANKSFVSELETAYAGDDSARVDRARMMLEHIRQRSEKR